MVSKPNRIILNPLAERGARYALTFGLNGNPYVVRVGSSGACWSIHSFLNDYTKPADAREALQRVQEA